MLHIIFSKIVCDANENLWNNQNLDGVSTSLLKLIFNLFLILGGAIGGAIGLLESSNIIAAMISENIGIPREGMQSLRTMVAAKTALGGALAMFGAIGF